MGFVFRGYYQRSSGGSHSSNHSYYTHLANQCDVESYNGGRYDRFLGKRDVMMERQLEKEMIRREILAEKAAMRRELEAEVRRELREEREMELRWRGGDHWEAPRRSFEKIVALPVQERMYEFPRLEERMSARERMYDLEEGMSVREKMYDLEEGMSVQERIYDFPRLEEGSSRGYEKEELPFRIGRRSYEKEELPFQRAPLAIKSEAKPPLDEEKKQIISLAKPDANHSGKKRKDMSSSVEGPSEVTKNLIKEWTCALCQISSTSELGLKEHLKGKKHKSKQAGQKLGMIGFCSKKINPSQVVGAVELEKSQQIPNKLETGVEKGCGGADRKMPKKKKMKFKFYCQMCEVGAFSEEIMANHEKGKKHLLRLHKLGAKR